LDRNRLRRATLVRGFRISRAAAFRSCGTAGGGCRIAFDGPPPYGRPVASRREEPRRGGLLAAPSGWATHLQPNVAPVATAARESTHHQYSIHTVTVVRGGRPSGSPTEGSGLSRGGTPWGDNRSSEKVRRPRAASDGDFRGNRPPGPAHLSLPEAAGPCCSVLFWLARNPFHLVRDPLHRACRRAFGTPGTTPRRPSSPLHHADLGGLVGPRAHPSAAPFCRSVPLLSH
jgi:hypothetical protein